MIRYSAYRNYRYWLLIQEFANVPLEKAHSDITRKHIKKHIFTDIEKHIVSSVQKSGLVLHEFLIKKHAPKDAPKNALAWYTYNTAEKSTLHIYHPFRWILKGCYISTITHELGHHYHLTYLPNVYDNEDAKEIIAELFSLEVLNHLKIEFSERRSLDYLANYTTKLKLTDKEFIKIHKIVMKLIRIYFNKVGIQ